MKQIKEIKDLIKQIRKEKFTSQEQMARELCLNYNWLIKVENGTIKEPSFTKMMKILDCAGWGINRTLEFLYGHKMENYTAQNGSPTQYCRYCHRSNFDLEKS